MPDHDGNREEAIFGEAHQDAAITQSMNNLAVLLHNAGDYDEAKELYRGTLTLREAALGDDHPDTINSMNNLGVGTTRLRSPCSRRLLRSNAGLVRSTSRPGERPPVSSSATTPGEAARYERQRDR